MRVQQINNQDYQPSFEKLKITQTARKLMSEKFNAQQLEQIKIWEKELGNTNHYDLRISGVVDRFVLMLDHKPTINGSFEGPLHAEDVAGKKLNVWGTDILDCGDFVGFKLKFPSKKEAREAFDVLKNHEKSKYDNFNRIAWAVDSTKIINKALDNSGNKTNVLDTIKKPIKSFWTRLKKAYNAFMEK